MVPRWLWVVRAAVVVAAVSSCALALLCIAWLSETSDDCDYEQDCFDRWFPVAYFWADWLWVIVVVAGAVAVIASLHRARRAAQVLLTTSWIALVLCCLAFPRPGLFGSGPLQDMGEPWFFNTYVYAALVVLAASEGLVLGAVLARRK